MRNKVIVIVTILIVLVLLSVLVYMKINSKKIELTEDGTYSIKLDETFSNANEKMDVIEKLIRKNFDKKFNFNDYDVHEYNEPGSVMYGAVELKYKINDTRTNLGYIVYAKKNKITEIITNMKDVDLEKYKNEFNEANKVYAKFENTEDIESKTRVVNKIWVGTFQLAWNELMKQLGGNIELEGAKSSLVEELNKQKFTKEMLNENSYYIKTGAINTLLRDEINKELKNKFNTESDVINKIDWNSTGNDYLIYAMLNKNFTFKTPFPKFTKTFGNSEKNVMYFGLETSTVQDTFKQVTALFYNSPSDFAVKIDTKEGEELILYRTDSSKSFEESYEEILQKANKYTGTKELKNEKDELKVPFINLTKNISYNELNDRIIKGKNGAKIKGTLQTVNFNLDNYGGNIKSEALIHTLMSYSEETPRYFNFTDTFLLYLKEKDKTKPYFALKVDDTEFLVESKEK